MRRWSVPSACLLISGLVASGCGGASGPDGARGGQAGKKAYAKDGTFTMAANVSPGSFDPYPVGGLGVSSLAYLAYDSLVNQLPDGRFVSGLAQKWEVDDSSATFTLRPDVTCSDGTPLTAKQVADAVGYVSDPKNASVHYGVNTPTVPLTATGDDGARTVKIVTERPYGFLLHSIGRLPIVCAKGMKDREPLKTGSDGTGPYVLSQVVAGQQYVFTVRKDYAWGPNGAKTSAPGTPAKIIVRVIENPSTRANLLLSGELNLAQVTGPNEQRLQARGLTALDWKLSGAWLSFNHDENRATSDKRVRQALISALDLSRVVKVSTGGTGRAADGFMALEPRVCDANTVAGLLPAHDPAAAATLLDQAGWTKGADGVRQKNGEPLTFDILHFAAVSEYEKPTAEYLASVWRALGIQVNVPNYSPTKGPEILHKTSNWDVYVGGWRFALPSQMVPFLSGPTPPKGTNVALLDNSDYNRLSSKAATVMPPQACDYWKEAERAIIGNLDIVPVSNRIERWYVQGAEARIQRYNAPIPTSIKALS